MFRFVVCFVLLAVTRAYNLHNEPTAMGGGGIGATCLVREPLGICEPGLECRHLSGQPSALGVCVRHVHSTSATTAPPSTTVPALSKCQYMMRQAMLTMVIWAGKWSSRCAANGDFQPKQCDISGHCFCVNADGVRQGQKTLEDITCPPVS